MSVVQSAEFLAPKHLFVLLSPTNDAVMRKLNPDTQSTQIYAKFRNPEGTIIHTAEAPTKPRMLALLATVPNAFAGFATVRRSQLVV